MERQLTVNDIFNRIVCLPGKGIASALLSEAFSRAKVSGAKEACVIYDLPFLKIPALKKHSSTRFTGRHK